MRDRLPGPVLLNCVRVRQRLRDLRVRRQIALNVQAAIDGADGGQLLFHDGLDDWNPDDFEIALELPVRHMTAELALLPLARGHEMLDERIAEQLAPHCRCAQALRRVP